MAVPLLIEKYKKLRSEPAWKLLAADTTPEVLAILQTLLFDTDRRLKESVMIEKLLRIYNNMETGTVTRETVTSKIREHFYQS